MVTLDTGWIWRFVITSIDGGEPISSALKEIDELARAMPSGSR